MRTTLGHFALFALSTCMLAGCGETGLPVLDKSGMGDGTTNRTALGGFWWTYVDRTLLSEVIPNTGKTNPTDAWSTRLRPGFARGVGAGIEVDGGQFAYHVTGNVAPVPSQLVSDGYWNEFYKDLCKDGDCGELKYPAAGVGFGFKAKNAILGADAIGRDNKTTKGVGFRMKVGQTHSKLGGEFRTVAVSAPMDLTDAPDASFGDEFGTKYEGLNSTLYPGKNPSANLPICSFPNSFKPNGTDTYNAGSKTCFCNLTKTLTVTDQWQTFCVTWEDFRSPGWGGLSGALVPDGGITNVIPERVIKLQFDAYKPSASEPAAAFDFWIDDVKLLSQSDWDAYCSSKRI